MLRPVRSPDFRCFAIPLKVKKLNSNFRSHLGKFKFGLKTEKRPDRDSNPGHRRASSLRAESNVSTCHLKGQHSWPLNYRGTIYISFSPIDGDFKMPSVKSRKYDKNIC